MWLKIKLILLILYVSHYLDFLAFLTHFYELMDIFGIHVRIMHTIKHS